MGLCELRVRKEGGKGCEHFKDGYCNHPNEAYYRCIDYLASGNIHLSYSQKNSWERCPYKWYLENVKGIKKRKEKQTPALKMGKELGRLVSGIGEPEIFAKEEEYNKQLSSLMYKIMEEYEMLPKKGIEFEVKVDRDGFVGVLDMVMEERSLLAELKFTTDPSRYLTKSSAAHQLTGYFYLRPDLRHAIMLPVQVSKLKDKKGQEDPLEKMARIEADVKRRINFYFPHYDDEKEPPKWGLKFSAAEFDLTEFAEGIKWAKEEIIRSLHAGYFPQRVANCEAPFQCDFLPIYNTGGVNWNIFEKRKQGDS